MHGVRGVRFLPRCWGSGVTPTNWSPSDPGRGRRRVGGCATPMSTVWTLVNQGSAVRDVMPPDGRIWGAPMPRGLRRVTPEI